MVTGQQPPVFTPEDLRKNFERLQTDLNVVQNELDQALGVWRTILDGEKLEFKKLLEDREKIWDRDEMQWQKDQQGYRQKIDELETYFKNQLAVTEKNAVRALNELDAAWQQERLRWQETLAQQSKETRQNVELQNGQPAAARTARGAADGRKRPASLARVEQNASSRSPGGGVAGGKSRLAAIPFRTPGAAAPDRRALAGGTTAERRVDPGPAAGAGRRAKPIEYHRPDAKKSGRSRACVYEHPGNQGHGSRRICAADVSAAPAQIRSAVPASCQLPETPSPRASH